jgi:hypothetical protein
MWVGKKAYVTKEIMMLVTLKQFSERHPWPSVVGLRNWFFRSQKNERLFPLKRCFKKVGSRVLVDDVEFFKAVTELNNDEE